MSTSEQSGSPSEPYVSPAATALARGTACLPCRRRKMRCDGRKPACGQCISKGREEDCEYTSDTQGLTRTQLLEENISLLESRIRELENPSESTSVRLHVPQDIASHVDMPFTSTVPVPAQTSSSSRNVASSSRGGASGSSSASGAVVPEPTLQDIHNLVNAFIPYASQVGFFLSMTRFVQMAYLPVRNRDPLEESLLSAVCLWGSHLSRSPALRAFEEKFLSKAVKEVSNALFLAGPSEHGRTILGAIQAEVLLANYFFSSGRFLEGKYHSSAAASLAITCRLNVLGLPGGAGADVGLAMGLIRGTYYGLPVADVGDTVDQGERINAFWTVYVMDKCWSVALGSPSSICDSSTSGARISTPWPLSMQQYEQGQIAAYAGQPVVADFLNNRSANNLSYCSSVALRAKAATLFSQASILACRYHANMPDKPLFLHEFSRLDNLITAFINTLPQIQAITSGDTCDTLVACTVARVAVIQLHLPFVVEQDRSRDSCVAAANSIVAMVQNININHFGYIDPIMAILLSAVCQVFMGEIKMYGAMRVFADEYITGLRMSLDRVLAIMTDFGAVCPLMASQVTQVSEARAAI